MSSKKKVVLLSSIIASVVVLTAAVVFGIWAVRKIRSRPDARHSDVDLELARPDIGMFRTNDNRILEICIRRTEGRLKGIGTYQVSVTNTANNIVLDLIGCSSVPEANDEKVKLLKKYQATLIKPVKMPEFTSD